LLLLDLNLGGRSGFELLGEFKKRGLSIPSLVLTMSNHPRYVAEAVRLGAAGYILKGATRAELLQAIESVCMGKRYFVNDVAELAMRGFTQKHEHELLAKLSPREQQIITMVVSGQTSKIIAEQLHLASKTVDIYRSRIMRKLGVDSIASLVRLAIRNGIIDSEIS
jgi:two-component system, NarL family, invasion response regulator UvrY